MWVTTQAGYRQTANSRKLNHAVHADVVIEVPVMPTFVRIETIRKDGSSMSKPKVAFICIHNSCRSQIAEALGKHTADNVFDSYSAGTELKDRINPDAVRLMKHLHGIDMEQTQHPKLLSDIPPVDVVITMGCNVECPYLPCKRREDWGLPDPTGKSDEEFISVIQTIETKITQLAESL